MTRKNECPLVVMAGALKAGECYEVHCSGGDTAPQGMTTAADFVERWEHAALGLGNADLRGRFLGIVHDGGAPVGSSADKPVLTDNEREACPRMRPDGLT